MQFQILYHFSNVVNLQSTVKQIIILQQKKQTYIKNKKKHITNMQQQVILQQKQTYLREHIDPNMYEDFYEFCEKHIGNVDITSWNMKQIQDIVNKFKNKVHQKALNDGLKLAKYSYNDYQSKRADHKAEHDYPEDSQMSEVQSNKVAKLSAVSLLDEVLQSQSKSNISKTKPNVQNNDMKNFNNTVSQNGKKNYSSVNFSQFDFWTSTISSGTPKISNQVRNKSTNQYKTTKINSFTGSPSTPKNAYNISEYGLTNPNFNQNSNININLNNNNQSTKFSQQKLKTNDFDLFTLNLDTNNKKTSPYIKKQTPNQPNPGTRTSTIRLKEIRQLHQEPSRGLSINRTKGKNQLTASDIPFNQSIACFKSAIRTQLADRSLNIFLDKHQIIERKFLAADYAMYNIKIVPLGVQCQRNYQDFLKLRTNLGKFFPGIHLPYLEQLSWFSGTNLQYINHQKKMLQMFARDLIRNKQFRNSRVMEDFLTLKDHKAIKRKFQKYEQMQPLKGIQQLCLLEGKVNTKINCEQKRYIEQVQKFISSMGALYGRYQKLSQNLIQQYEELMKTYKQLTELMSQIEKQIKQLNSKNTINVIKYLGNSIKILRQTYKQQYSYAKFQTQINSNQILPFLHYQKKNFIQLNKLIQVQKKLNKAYDKRSLTQKIGVGQTYQYQISKTTKKGVLEESDSLLVLKYQVGYIGNQVTNQGQRVFDQLAIKTVAKWQHLSQLCLDKLTNIITYWQTVSKIDRNKFNTELTF